MSGQPVFGFFDAEGTEMIGIFPFPDVAAAMAALEFARAYGGYSGPDTCLQLLELGTVDMAAPQGIAWYPEVKLRGEVIACTDPHCSHNHGVH